MGQKSLRTTPPSIVCKLLLLLAWPLATLHAQNGSSVETLAPLPAGITVPVQISRAIHAGSTMPGETIIGETTQRIPLSKDHYLNRGAKVVGTIVVSKAGDGGATQPYVLAIRFTSLRYRNQTVSISTRAIAIANASQVGFTADPASMATDRGNSNPANWTTRQVGEDVLSRCGWIGELDDNAMRKVGFADYYGVYADPPPDATGIPSIPRAVGVFSTSARGLYGFDEGATLRSSGGDITITSPRRLVLRNGDNLLLEVIPTSATSSANPPGPSGSTS
jgi:hypothetical protein